MADADINISEIQLLPKPASRRFIDIEGQRFGRLIAEGFVGCNKTKNALWLCRCDCGNRIVRTTALLRFGNVKSCGCLAADVLAQRSTKHGLASRGNTRHPLYTTWKNINSRCNNPKNKRFNAYGGRGIKVCDRWRHSFVNFLADMGERPDGLTLERKDVNGDYSPENCIWASWKDQMNNTQHSRYITFNGKTQTMLDWARELSINYGSLKSRFRYGWTVEEALSIPIVFGQKIHK